MFFTCPKCKGRLNTIGNAVRCEAGHSYDRARAGYYNLLLSCGGGNHGDNKEMLDARRSFLNLGYYEPLRDALVHRVCEKTSDGDILLDAGCGEGYYTDAVERALRLRDGGSNVLAFDISKDAVRYTVMRNREISLAVASSYDIPMEDGSVDCLINVFSPMAIAETVRVLKRGGVFIMVYPGEDHLFALKEAIYDTPYRNEPKDTDLPSFRLLSLDELKYDMHFSTRGEVGALFMMTPYAYRTGRVERERAMSIEQLKCQAHFFVATYEKII